MLDLKQIEALTSLPQLNSQKELTQRADVLVVLLTEEDLAQPSSVVPALSNKSLVEELKKKKKVVLFGGNDDKFGVAYVRVTKFGSNYEIFEAAGDQTRALLNDKVTSVTLHFPESATGAQVSTFLEGVLLANYKYVRKSYIGVDESAQFKRITSVTVVSKNVDLKSDETNFALQNTQYSLLCRQVLSLRPLDANPESLLEFCKNLAKIDSKITFEAIVGKELTEKGLNLIYSVGRGASKAPCLVLLKYEGNPQKADDVIAFVGKGVCFDAGGLNLKPTGAIEEMWCDKGGAVTVLSAFKGVVEQKLPVNLVVAVAFVENLVGSDAYHPSDIIKSYKGITVDIQNTDAEGRLILADAMSYTQEKHKPNTLIELSTLTGAVRIALGLTTAGLFSNSEELVSDLLNVSQTTSERLWRLPIFEEHRNNMKGPYADLNNIGGRGMGGASCAAAFLEVFVEKDVNWAHIDIAGTAIGPERFVYSEGSSGFGVRLLLNYLRQRTAKK